MGQVFSHPRCIAVFFMGQCRGGDWPGRFIVRFSTARVTGLVGAGRLSPGRTIVATFSRVGAGGNRLGTIIDLHRRGTLRRTGHYISLTEPFTKIPVLLGDLNRCLRNRPTASNSGLFGSTGTARASGFIGTLRRTKFVVVKRSGTPRFNFAGIASSGLCNPTHGP